MAAAHPSKLAGLFTDTAAVYRRCFRPLLVLGAVSAVVTGGTGLALVSLYATTLMTAVVSFNPAGLASGPLLAAACAWLASMLVTVQCGAMVAQVASRAAEGHVVDLRAAWLGTTTVVPRLLLPCLMLSAGTWLVCAVGLTVVLNALGAARLSAAAGRASALSTVLAVFGAVALAVLASVAITWWLRVRLFLLLPAASLEKLSGNAPGKRSWQLTGGRGGLVFGVLVVAGLAEGAAIGLGFQVASALVSPPVTGDFGGLVALVSQLMPAVTVATASGAAMTTLTWPFLTVASTLLHRALTGHRLNAAPQAS